MFGVFPGLFVRGAPRLRNNCFPTSALGREGEWLRAPRLGVSSHLCEQWRSRRLVIHLRTPRKKLWVN
jgi:hypothetical protein